MGEESQALLCDDCQLGYADCRCIASWSTPEEKKARAQEIQAIKAQVYEKLKNPPRPKRFVDSLHVELPSDMLTVLELHQGRRSLAETVIRLLRSHSSPKPKKRALRFIGKPSSLHLRLPRELLERIKRKGEVECKNPSVIIFEHLARELAWEGQDD